VVWSACCSGSSPTHRFSTAPKSRRTVNSFPPRWWHGGLRSTAPSMSILLSSPRWGRLIAFLQRPNHGALSFLSRPGGGNTLAMRFLHMARLCHGTLSFLSRPGGGNTLATAYCCIWHAYATVSTGQRLPFASWLLGSVTMRHCGAVSLSRSLLTIVSSFSISPVDTSCSFIVMRTHVALAFNHQSPASTVAAAVDRPGWCSRLVSSRLISSRLVSSRLRHQVD
jgi:hypothetical protein